MLANSERTFEVMSDHGIDTLIATAPENVAYFTGFWSVSHWLERTQVYAIVSIDRHMKPILVAPMTDIDLVTDLEVLSEDVEPYGKYCFSFADHLSAKDRKLKELAEKESKKTPLDALVKALKKRGMDTGTIGLDSGNITPGLLNLIPKKLPGANFIEAAGTFQEIRISKSKKEVDRIRSSVEITERAMVTALNSIKESVTEKEVAVEFEKAVVESGATPLFSSIGFGVGGAYPNAQPSARKLKRGDVIRFDIGVRKELYCSDIARTFFFGSPSEKQKRFYNAILEGETEALGKVKEGTKVSEIFNKVISTVRKAGIPHYSRHHCGHGIGIGPFESPIVAPENETSLQEGMVLCIETPYVEVGFGGFQLEDVVLVNKDGCELLSTANKALSSI